VGTIGVGIGVGDGVGVVPGFGVGVGVAVGGRGAVGQFASAGLKGVALGVALAVLDAEGVGVTT